MDHQEEDIELESYAASEPPTPQERKSGKAVFEGAMSRPLHYGRDRRIRRKREVRSVYLRDGETHNVWKPNAKHASRIPSTPSPPPPALADVVQAVMKQNRDLIERQRKLFSRVTATQAVLKEQNEELATVAEMTEESEDEKEAAHGEASEENRQSTPSKKMWRQAIKSIIDENKVSDSKVKKRDRKRSTVHFHEVVTNKMVSMGSSASSRFHSTTSDQSDPSPAPISPKVRRHMSLSHSKRTGAVTPGAIPFTEWKSQFYQRQKLVRQSALRHYQSEHDITPPLYHDFPRMSSEYNLQLKERRASSVHSMHDVEPRSKSCSQYHNMCRRSSSPEILDYEQDNMSDGSVALDEVLSPFSSRSVSPAVFSDEEERQSKHHRRTPLSDRPGQAKFHHSQSVEEDSSGQVINLRKNPAKQNKKHREVFVYDDGHPKAATPDGMQSSSRPNSRPHRISFSLPSSPRSTPTPSPSPYPPPSKLTLGPRLSISPGVSPTPSQPRRKESLVPTAKDINDRISREQCRRESQQHTHFHVKQLSDVYEMDEQSAYSDNATSPPPILSEGGRGSPSVLTTTTTAECLPQNNLKLSPVALPTSSQPSLLGGGLQDLGSQLPSNRSVRHTQL